MPVPPKLWLKVPPKSNSPTEAGTFTVGAKLPLAANAAWILVVGTVPPFQFPLAPHEPFEEFPTQVSAARTTDGAPPIAARATAENIRRRLEKRGCFK